MNSYRVATDIKRGLVEARDNNDLDNQQLMKHTALALMEMTAYKYERLDKRSKEYRAYVKAKMEFYRASLNLVPYFNAKEAK